MTPEVVTAAPVVLTGRMLHDDAYTVFDGTLHTRMSIDLYHMSHMAC